MQRSKWTLNPAEKKWLILLRSESCKSKDLKSGQKEKDRRKRKLLSGLPCQEWKHFLHRNNCIWQRRHSNRQKCEESKSFWFISPPTSHSMLINRNDPENSLYTGQQECEIHSAGPPSSSRASALCPLLVFLPRMTGVCTNAGVDPQGLLYNGCKKEGNRNSDMAKHF